MTQVNGRLMLSVVSSVLILAAGSVVMSIGSLEGDAAPMLRSPKKSSSPTISIDAPLADAVVQGPVTVVGSAADASGVAKVELSVDGTGWKLAEGTVSRSYLLDTKAHVDGAHPVEARVTSAVGTTAVTSASLMSRNASMATPDGCLSTASPVVAVSGSRTSQFKTTSAGVGTGFDARTASWVGVADWTVHVAGGSDNCWSGGRIDGMYPDSTSWETLHHTGAMTIFSPRPTVENVRIHNHGDGIRFVKGAKDFAVRGAHLSFVRDDCMENDYLYSGQVEDSLFDGCYVGFSARTYTGQTYTSGANNVWAIRGSLMRLQPMPTVYKGAAPGHGGFFKLDGAGLSPKLSLHNNIFRVDQAPNHGTIGLPDDAVADCSNNIVVWLGSGPYPASLPSCFTVTTDRTVWDNAVATWKNNHPGNTWLYATKRG